MKAKIITGSIAALMILLLSNTYKVASTGAPIASTGAPGETTCGRSGCHTGNNNINSGTGLMQVEVEDLNGAYVPGKTYRVTVAIQQKNINRFGFSLVALNNNGASAGTLHATNVSRTQVLAGSNQFAQREYMTYKALGTDPYTENQGLWAFNWTAPEQNEGPVKFYVATVAADNDGTDQGDEVYTDSVVVRGASTGIKQEQDAFMLSIYPNPAKQAFGISFNNNISGYTKVLLSDLKGGRSYPLWEGALPAGAKTLSLETPQGLAKGIYLLQVCQATKVFTQKLIIE